MSLSLPANNNQRDVVQARPNWIRLLMPVTAGWIAWSMSSDIPFVSQPLMLFALLWIAAEVWAQLPLSVPLTVAPDGFHFGAYGRRRFVPWSHVQPRSFRVSWLSISIGGPPLTYLTWTPVAGREPLPRPIQWLNWLLVGAKVSLPAKHHAASLESIAELLNLCRDKYQAATDL